MRRYYLSVFQKGNLQKHIKTGAADMKVWSVVVEVEENGRIMQRQVNNNW